MRVVIGNCHLLVICNLLSVVCEEMNTQDEYLIL